MQSDINEAFFCVPAGQTGGFLPFAVLEGRALAVQSGISEVFFCAPAGRTGGFLPFAVLEVRSLSCSQALVKYFSARLRDERAAFDRLVLEGRALAVQSDINEAFFCGPAGRTGGFLRLFTVCRA